MTPDASKHDVKAAYRALVKCAHPDRGGDQRWFVSLSDAYDVASSTPPIRPQHEHFLRASTLATIAPLPTVGPRRQVIQKRTFADELKAALAR